MKAVQIGKDHKISVIETEDPKLKKDEIIVRPLACGICGTDLHICEHGFPGTNYPVTPGHEFAGHVVSVGGDVTGVREGDFVAVNPNVSCGVCEWCKERKPHLCTALTPIGVGRAGAAAELVAVPGKNAFVVKENVGHGVAALIEPLACALHSVESSQGVKDRRVLIMGAGTMGLLTTIICRHFGAAEVTVVDPVVSKHVKALEVGATRVALPDEIVDERYDVVFEAVGSMPSLKKALNHIRKTGVLVQLGVHAVDSTVEVNPFTIYEHELKIIGSNSLANQFSDAVQLMYDVRDKAEKLIGKTFSVWDFEDAVKSMAAGQSIKTQLSFD